MSAFNQETPDAGDLSGDRLSSWKEIAAYFKSGVRTVQRWERLEGLPVHRHQHQKAGTVYAVKSELDVWWKERQRRVEAPFTPPRREQDLPQAKTRLPIPFNLRRPFALTLALLALLGTGSYLSRQVIFPKPKAPNGKMMLAVLPFANPSGDATQDYFSDGLTEEMITQLGRLDPNRLGVIARTSAMKYKHTDKDVAQIGKELGADYILEGSARRAGNQVRVSAQLIQASDQTHLWAQSYERQIDDVLNAQEEVARSIGEEIRANLNAQRAANLAVNRQPSSEAHEAYLQGRYFWNRRGEAELRRGIEYFQEAVTRDPNYAAAYAGLADCYILLGLNGSAPREVMPKAKAAALKALEID